jgi:hypothetical protein
MRKAKAPYFFKNSPSGLFFYALLFSRQPACFRAEPETPLASWLFSACRFAVRIHRTFGYDSFAFRSVAPKLA